ncbi:MAG: zinc-ribbon domain-containing protein [Schwartzia sp. (in: firmicutes)]
MQKFCTHCGKKLVEVLNFCTYCGAPLGAKPLNPKLVLEAPLPAEPVAPHAPVAPHETVEPPHAEDMALEFLPLDFKPLEAAVLRKEPLAPEETRREEKDEASASAPIVKAAEIVPVAAVLPVAADEEPSAAEDVAPRDGDLAGSAEQGEVPRVGDRGEASALASAEMTAGAEEPADVEQEESVGKETREAQAEADKDAEPAPSSDEPTTPDEASAEASDAAGVDAPGAAGAAADEAEKPEGAQEEEADDDVADGRSGGVVRWLFRILLLFVLLVGGLMVYRGVGFDKLMADPAGTVRLLLGQAAVDAGMKDDAFWYPDTKQGAWVRGSYAVSSGRTVCWYGGTVQKDGRTYANGDGVANWYRSDGAFEQSDEGTFVAGCRQGKIKHTYADGRVETLQWKNGEQVK